MIEDVMRAQQFFKERPVKKEEPHSHNGHAPSDDDREMPHVSEKGARRSHFGR